MLHEEDEVIVAAAVKTSDDVVWSVPRPARHDAVFLKIAAAVGYDIHDKRDDGPGRREWVELVVKDRDEGFITEDGTFLDRKQALAHARACDQLLPGAEILGGLTSEDVWEDES